MMATACFEQKTFENGAQEFTLDPPLQLLDPEEITLDVFERGCFLLGVDPDQWLMSDDPEPLPDEVPLAHWLGFFELICENDEAYDLQQMPTSHAKILLGVCADHFRRASSGS